MDTWSLIMHGAEMLAFNFVWMSWNIFLGLLGWFFALAFAKVHRFRYKFLFMALWLLFVPNSVYMLTDVKHLPSQLLRIDTKPQLVLLSLQFSVLLLMSVLSYWLSLTTMYSALKRWLKETGPQLLKVIERYEVPLVMALNFVIAFGVIMGRVMRTNSWYLFTQPVRVLSDALTVAGSKELMLFVILFGILTNTVYFTMRILFAYREN